MIGFPGWIVPHIFGDWEYTPIGFLCASARCQAGMVYPRG